MPNLGFNFFIDKIHNYEKILANRCTIRQVRNKQFLNFADRTCGKAFKTRTDNVFFSQKMAFSVKKKIILKSNLESSKYYIYSFYHKYSRLCMVQRSCSSMNSVPSFSRILVDNVVVLSLYLVLNDTNFLTRSLKQYNKFFFVHCI